jgi:hypothetical protein
VKPNIFPISNVGLKSESGSENIFILRSFYLTGYSSRFWPEVDGQVVAGIFPKQYIALAMSEGEHTIGVKCCANDQIFLPGIPVRTKWSTSELKILIEKHKKYYFQLTLSNSFFSSDVEIKPIDENEALGKIVSYKKIENGKISNCKGESVLATDTESGLCF